MIAAAILVGGRAKRFGGVAKPLVPVGSERIVDRQRAVLAPLVDELVLVTRPGDERYRELGLRVLHDRYKDAGPLAGLEAALVGTRADELLLCAGDMPALVPAAVRLLAEHAPGADAVVPWVGGRYQPLFARYHRRILALVERRLAAQKLSLHGLLAELAVSRLDEVALRTVDPELRSLTNLNSEADLERFLRES